MKLEYKIIDNFLPKNEFKLIEDLIIYSNSFPWYYQDQGVSHINSGDSIYFTHIVYNFNNNLFNFSNYYQNIFPIISRLDIKSLIRIKANLYPKTNTIYEHDSHFDYKYPHKGFLYYINTNNGFTKLADGTKIKSVKNRCLFFDPSILHNSSTCSDKNSRININFNYF